MNVIYYEYKSEVVYANKGMHDCMRCKHPDHKEWMGGYCLKIIDEKNGIMECCASKPHRTRIARPFQIVKRDLWQEWKDEEEEKRKKKELMRQ